MIEVLKNILECPSQKKATGGVAVTCCGEGRGMVIEMLPYLKQQITWNTL